ncbi:hypothetical protein Tco_0486517 [Tanacetum coccineum]
MKELSEQLKELSDKGFIRPSSSPWGAPVLIDDLFDQLQGSSVYSKIDLSSVRSEDLEALSVWNSKRGPEFTWEREDQFRKKYPHLFSKTGPSSSAAS